MANPYLEVMNTRATPQAQPIPGREPEMAKNRAGGFVFTLDKWSQLDRFLILGTEGATYYASEREMTVENAGIALACIAEDGERVVSRIVELDRENRAPKAKPLLFALALCHQRGDLKAKQAAAAALPAVARTGTHLFLYLGYLVALGSKLGRSKRAAVQAWLASKAVDDLAYQMAKYANRERWTWRDLIRICHPKPATEEHARLLRWAARGEEVGDGLPGILRAASAAKLAETTDAELVRLVLEEHVSHEMIPPERQSKDVWAALALKAPATALLRNLGRLGSLGLIVPLSETARAVASRIADAEWLRKSRIHPIQILSALGVYGQGHGERGGLSWTPVPQVIEALETAFYGAFGQIEPTAKRWLLAVDVSGSMTAGNIAGVPGLTPNVAAACMAMATARAESAYYVMGFANVFRDLGVTAQSKLSDVVDRTSAMSFGATDCALPMLWALKNGIEADAFVVYTDSETWAGSVQPVQALQRYRSETGINARLIVVGFTSTGYSIADPKDGGMLDVVGFDAAAPRVMAEFVR